MRKVILQMMLTLDGFIAGPDGEADWHNVDEEFNEYSRDFLCSVDTLIFGRSTYELMASYWPTQAANDNDPVTAGYMNAINKLVFSKTMKKVDWENTTLAKGNAIEEITKLKKQLGKEIAILGSSDFARSIIQTNLIDEYRFIINPIVLGKGKPLFHGTQDSSKLKLLKTRIFQSGNVLLIYQPLNNSGYFEEVADIR